MSEDSGEGPADPGDASEVPASTPAPLVLAETPSVYLPIYVLTCVFGAIFIIGPFLIRKGPNKEIIRHCLMMTAFLMWIFWVTVYIAQINPLMNPRLHNVTLAWIKNKNTNLTASKAEDDDGDNDDE